MPGNYSEYLTPGRVLRFTANFPQGSKEKYHILTDCDENPDGCCRFFLINSRPAPFIQDRPALIEQQLLLERNELGFLHHDSYVACHEVREEFISDVVLAIHADPDRVLVDSISGGIAQRILSVVDESVTLNGLEKALIRTGLEQVD